MHEKEYKPTDESKTKKENKIMNRKDELKGLAYKVAHFLKAKYKIKRIFLIGSLVGGIVHEKSDIDLVVEGLPPELYIKALTEAYDILSGGVELNLIPFEDAFPSLKEKTLKKGELIYG